MNSAAPEFNNGCSANNTDMTPTDWFLPKPSFWERGMKRPARRLLYQGYLKFIDPVLRKRFDPSGRYRADQWYWGMRGLDYAALRRKVNNLKSIRECSIVVQGCGTGKDVPSWVEYRPKALMGIDLFSYKRAWEQLKKQYGHLTSLTFGQGDLESLPEIASESIDIVASDAVFEHVRNLKTVAKESHRILCRGGILYATFGPLWFSWGGDHLGADQALKDGYNHLLLPPEAYRASLNDMGEHSHSEEDGRTWIRNGLFSYLRPNEYLQILEEVGFRREHLGMVVEPRAVRCLELFPEVRRLVHAQVDPIDAVISAMTLIVRK